MPANTGDTGGGGTSAGGKGGKPGTGYPVGTVGNIYQKNGNKRKRT